MKKTNTNKTNMHVKCLVYGAAGIGKTTLCTTAPRPLIVSAEGGLLSLKGLDPPIDVIEIKTEEDISEVLEYLEKKKTQKKYDTICIDSLSDIAEVVLAEQKATYTNKQQAYGEYNDIMMEIIKSFRDLKGYHVYMTAKRKRGAEEEQFCPHITGATMLTNLPYLFDEVLALVLYEDGEDSYRVLQCKTTDDYEVKDRSGELKKYEKPDLEELFKKILTKKGGKRKGKK